MSVKIFFTFEKQKLKPALLIDNPALPKLNFMKKMFILLAFPLFFQGCTSVKSDKTDGKRFLSDQTTEKVMKELVAKCGEAQKSRIEKGVMQIASIWTEKDGNDTVFISFCKENFIGSDTALDIAFNKLSRNYEIIYGGFNKMGLDLRMPLELNMGEVTPVDMLFGGYDASAHITEDFYNNKIAFVVMLNFPFYSLKEKNELGKNWTRKQWAYARMGDIYTSRVPADLNLKAAEVYTKGDAYISEYNIFMGNLLNERNETLFPKGMKLITHWGLRDELKSDYAAKNALEKQKMIYQVMKRIITQEIPTEVINSDQYQWDPYSNKVTKGTKELAFTREPDTRYQHLLDNFKIMKEIDPYCPLFPTYIQRKFDSEMEMSVDDVEKLFIDMISNPIVKDVAALISKRLNRKLEPFDIWYDGFKPRSFIPQEELDAKTKAKYPTVANVQADLPNILIKLGFTKEEAMTITSHITVDGSRGAGHAAGAYMKGDKARLRTRVGSNGMDYKGYNIATHEFGHTVEQTLDLYNIDYYMLNGVPNTAFTEALAFMFQRRDLELLGIKDPNPNKEYLQTLDNFWSCYEIMGVSLVDINVWRWLYEHPSATAADLKQAVIRIASDTWNKYYANVFGSKDEPILAIYSHMIDYPLYLSAYPVGQIIDFQLEKQIKGKNFATEIKRIFTLGKLAPELWMEKAVGSKVSVDPMLESTKEAIEKLK
jgi:hypothetical protein